MNDLTLTLQLDCALDLYVSLANDTLALLSEDEAAPIATRFHALMLAKLRQVAPHRTALASLFAAALSDASAPNPFRAHTRLPEVFKQLVRGASDATLREDETQALANLLQSLHFMVLVFWLYDRTPDYRATAMLLDFLREMIKLVRPMLIMPLLQKALARLSAITGMMFETP